MQYNFLKRAGFSVSEIGLGCEHLQGKPYETIDAVVNAALDGGVNILDVFMSEPQVRADIGRALGARRGDVLLQGHIGSIWQDGQYQRSRDLQQCQAFIRDFLTRFHTDYIDIGMIHFIDTMEDLDRVQSGGVLEYALQLKRDGVIRSLGFSSHNPVTARAAVEAGWADVVMFSINPAYDLLPEVEIDHYFDAGTWRRDGLSGIDPRRAAFYEACAGRDVGITVMKTYGAGFLFNPSLSPFGKPMRPEQLIHYALSRPAAASALIGCQTVQEVACALAYETADAHARDYADVLGASQQFSQTRQCVYCNHCHPCPQRIDIAQVNRCLDLAAGGEAQLDAARARYVALAAHGGDCIGCGACMERCPFGVDVAARMQAAVKRFGI